MRDIADFLNNGRQHVFEYLPDHQEIHKVGKDWICNVIATVLKGEFTGWIRNQIEIRNAAVTKKKNLMIDMDPEVAAAFNQST